MPTSDQWAWVSNVLGFRLSSGAGQGITAPASRAKAVDVWIAAKEEVDQQLNLLYATIRGYGLPPLDKAAEEIEKALQGYRVGLVTALMNYESATGSAKDAARLDALKVIADYKKRIPKDKFVIGADENPLRIPVTIRAILGDALDRLDHRLASP
jgi:hypothetical protein